jgi:hypothetical protein
MYGMYGVFWSYIHTVVVIVAVVVVVVSVSDFFFRCKLRSPPPHNQKFLEYHVYCHAILTAAKAPRVVIRAEKVLPNARSKVRQTIITAKYWLLVVRKRKSP